MSSAQQEAFLAQEQGAAVRAGGVEKELEAEFGGGVKEGTLVLTNRSLIIVCTNERPEELPIGYYGEHPLLYSEVEDLGKIPSRSPNIFLSLEQVSVKGKKGGVGSPSLEFSWNGQAGSKTLVFTETMTGRREKSLNGWAAIVDGIRGGTRQLTSLPSPQSADRPVGEAPHPLSLTGRDGVRLGCVGAPYGVQHRIEWLLGGAFRA